MEEQKSIEQLEGDYWAEIKFPTGLVERCYRFRQIPVKDLSVEQIRVLLGQDIGVPYLLGKALQILEKDILADGDFYPGDLLNAVLNVNKIYWQEKPACSIMLRSLLQDKRSAIQQAGHKRLCREIERFLAEQCTAVS